MTVRIAGNLPAAMHVERPLWVRLGRADHLPGARTRGRCSPVSGPVRDGWIVAALGPGTEVWR
jgi:hypothetical protein